MSATQFFPEFRVGEPLAAGGVQAFPLFAAPAGQIDYTLAHQALDAASLLVEEIGEAGSVPELQVENLSDVAILFLEGEELIGAKQNRVLNTSVLAAAHSKLRIPVSCVEQGRWRYTSRQFRSSGWSSSSQLRRILKRSVTDSLKKRRGFRSDQGEVWEEVARQQESLRVESESCAMEDAYVSYEDHIIEARETIRPAPGAVGVAFAVRGKVKSIDFFDKPQTCAEAWPRLLSGVTMEALESPQADQTATAEEVSSLLAAAGAAAWEDHPAVGQGIERRAEFAGCFASALIDQGVVVHASIVTSA